MCIQTVCKYTVVLYIEIISRGDIGRYFGGLGINVVLEEIDIKVTVSRPCARSSGRGVLRPNMLNNMV